MAAQPKYPEELRERAVKMAFEVREWEGKGRHGENRPHIPAVLVTGIVTKTGRKMRDRMRPSGLPGNVCRGHTGWRATGDTHCDSARLAHNPEVAGSNPAPATKLRGPFSNRGRASCVSFVNGFVNVARVHAASPGSPPTSRPGPRP
jgi:hypothetical protein